METKLLEEVQYCLNGDRMLYQYYPDKYAVDIIDRHLRIRGDKSVRDLKQGNLWPLLNKPVVKDWVSQVGSGVLKRDKLDKLEQIAGYKYFDQTETFVLTLGSWGRYESFQWAQMSRPGENLVLQLNLSGRWSKGFKRMTARRANDYFGDWHPISETRDLTLSWARIDLDFVTNEVLIEEVQSDIVGFCRGLLKMALKAQSKGDTRCQFAYSEFDVESVTKYCRSFLSAFEKTWQDMMLAASLEFCFETLGVDSVFYHSFDSGNRLKNIKDRKPPKSLYSQLPRRFCFAKTKQTPQFILNDKRMKKRLKNLKDLEFYRAVV